MNKMFDAAPKHGVVDFETLSQVDAIHLNEFRKASEQPSSICRPVSSAPKSERVVRLRASSQSPIFPFNDAQHPAAEQYRIIRTKLLHSPQKPQLVVISSVSSGDGKTITSINIAGSLALKSDANILLVDSDLRHPSIAQELDIPATPGLTDVLSGRIELETALVRAEQFPNLFILSAGSPTANGAELLDSPQWQEFLKQIRARFANVIFDAPPIETVADYELLQLGCDGIILVVRPDHSNRSACMKALEIMPKRKFFGVVLNCVEDWWLWRTPVYGYYHKSFAEKKLDRKRSKRTASWIRGNSPQ